MSGFRELRVGTALVLAFTWVTVSVQPVAASNFGSASCTGGTPTIPTNCLSVGHNYIHKIYAVNLLVGMYNATVSSVNDDYNPTDLQASMSSDPNNTDVFVYDDYYSYALAGWAVCPAGASQGGSHPDHWCIGQGVYYNLNATDYVADAGSRAYLACHELGHTVGLRHSGESASCMTVNTPNGSSLLTAHDVAHINNYWRY